MPPSDYNVTTAKFLEPFSETSGDMSEVDSLTCINYNNDSLTQYDDIGIIIYIIFIIYLTGE